MASFANQPAPPPQSAPRNRWWSPTRHLAGGFFVRTALRAIFTIWFVATLLFFLFRLLPSSPIDVFVQEAVVIRGLNIDQARAEAAALFAVDLDRPVLLQYLDYMKELATGNFGESLVSRGTSVSSIVVTFLPWTLFTVGIGVALSYLLGIALGMLAAYWRGSWIDHLISLVTAFLQGIPQFVLGLLIIVYLGVQFQLFDIAAQRGAYTPGIETGFTWTFISDVLRHAWLPMVAYIISTISLWVLLMKNSTTAALEEDYVHVAHARGLRDWRIMLQYVGKNSMLPLVTYAAIAVGTSLGGSAIFETLFVYRGIGQRLTEAINARDYPVMQGIFLVLTAAVVISNLIADMLYGVIDPRIRKGSNR